MGLKDSNDEIVAATFQALAELVPLLGGQTVVGGQFNEHFHDMKPDVSFFVVIFCCIYLPFFNFYTTFYIKFYISI